MPVAKVTEITASSPQGFVQAVQLGMDRAKKTLENVKGAWIKGQKVVQEKGKISEYHVTLMVTFLIND